MFDLIVAVDSKNGIGLFDGVNYSIPWSVEVDTRFFMDMTSCGKENVIIMGRNTFLSLGSKPLAGRINVVVSSNHIEGVPTCRSLNAALEKCQAFGHDNVFVIGGRQLYQEALRHPLLRYAYVTRIDHDFGCNISLELGNLKLLGSKMFMLWEKRVGERVRVCFNKYGGGTNLCVENLEELNYLNILEELMSVPGRATRNANTFSKFGKQIEFSLRDGTFPMLTTKKLSLKIIVEELLFFLRGETNTLKLSEKGIKIWEPNTSREFLDRLGLKNYGVGDMGPMYGYQFRHFNAPYGSCDMDHEGKGVDQLRICLELLKNDPTSRRILMTAFNPSQMYEGVLHPCHGIVIQFYVERGKYLCCSMYQRSADIFLGFPINIASYSLLTYIMCELVNNDKEYHGELLEPGKVVISLGDYHLYESHYEPAARQILRNPKPFPKLRIKRKLAQINHYTLDDFELIDYNAMPTIKAEMIA
ncbi:MAG: thymidylate synthase [Hyperionvirus sp.]|uniref:thymidylate synthase n=1 Tax=Hyperionvirus sp. TaxID=2487770 RepID=A0A3G5ACH5_9VIRU|nr:MAG: thymidylate synthase [Hyperionvirus sp.]